MRATTLLLLVAAAGCTRPNGDLGGAPVYLDGAVKVSASGTRPRSSVTMERGGALDPASTAMEIMVNDAALSLRVHDHRALLELVDLKLDDIDLPPSSDLPNGLALRQISLGLPTPPPLEAKIEKAEPDQLVLTVTTPLVVHGSMLLADGSLYKLGDVPTEPGQLTVRVTSDGTRATAALDAAPPATCWSVGAPGKLLLSAVNCALFVESFADVQSL